MTIFYCLRFETPPTWKARLPYLYPPGTGWPSYTTPTTRRATLEVFEPTSSRAPALHSLILLITSRHGPHRRHSIVACTAISSERASNTAFQPVNMRIRNLLPCLPESLHINIIHIIRKLGLRLSWDMTRNTAGEWLALLLCTEKVQGSNFHPNTRFLAVSLGKCPDNTWNQATSASCQILSNSVFTYRNIISDVAKLTAKETGCDAVQHTRSALSFGRTHSFQLEERRIRKPREESDNRAMCLSCPVTLKVKAVSSWSRRPYLPPKRM
jgi:hypothetical protein